MGGDAPVGFEVFVRASTRPLLRAAWLLTADHHAVRDGGGALNRGCPHPPA